MATLLLFYSFSSTFSSVDSRSVDELLFGYNRHFVPFGPQPGTPLPVRVEVSPEWLEISPTGVLSGSVRRDLMWTDPRLTFEPEERVAIPPRVSIDPNLIWNPDIVLANRFGDMTI